MPSVLVTLASLKEVVRRIIKELRVRSKNQALVIALVGELGAGKTTFTQVLGEELGIAREAIRSPSFVLQKLYPLGSEGQPFKQLIHIDCYRLDTVDELQHLNWTEIMGDSGNLMVVEWADKIAPRLPNHYLEIRFTVVDECRRQLDWRWLDQTNHD